jgi:hypothetical protein
MQKHCRAAPDSNAVHGRNQRFAESNERIEESRLWAIARARGMDREIGQIVAGREGIARAVHENDTDLIVLVGSVELLCEGSVHRRRHRVLLRWD